jgi:hypothetical protein
MIHRVDLVVWFVSPLYYQNADAHAQDMFMDCNRRAAYVKDWLTKVRLRHARLVRAVLAAGA